VENGVVYLMGIAQDRAELDRVVDHARNIGLVTKVVSYVRIKGQGGGPPPTATG
jgi:osmotically-inducible protein OsmY